MSPLQQDNADDHGSQKSDAGECQREVDTAIFVVVGLVTDRENLQQRKLRLSGKKI
jgi:hypothetical protein